MTLCAGALWAADRSPEEAAAWRASTIKDVSYQMTWAEKPLTDAITQANGGDKRTAYMDRSGFAQELVEAAASPSPRPRIIFFPNPQKMRVSAANFVVSGVLPPNSRVDTIPICIEQNSEIKATFKITALGKVESDPWSGPTQAEQGKTACQPYFNQRVHDLGYLP